MVASAEKLNPEVGETESLIEDFKQKVIQSLERERSQIRDTAEKNAKLILTKAYQESANVTAKSHEESKRLLEGAKLRAAQEVETIVSQARARADQLVNDAEDICRREAREKTRKEIENLLRSAREESGKVVSKALLEAKEQAAATARTTAEEAEKAAAKMTREATDLKQKASATLADAQKKAAEAKTQLLETARKSAIEKAEKEAAEIIAQASAQGEKERKLLIANALVEARHNADLEATRMLNKAKQEADDFIREAKNKVNGQIEESSRLMLEIQQRMHQMIGTAVQQPAGAPVAKPPKDTPAARSSLSVEKENRANQLQEGEDSSTYDETNKTYQGRLKIDIAPPVDGDQVTQLEQYLLKTPNIKVLGKGGAEDGSAWLDMEAVKPVPLVEILKKVPAVKDVVGAKSYIIVALRAKQLV